MQITPQQLFASAAEGALILTANKRLFRSLRTGFDQWMQDDGADAWMTPSILSFDGWLLRCLDELHEEKQLLNSFQEQCLWEVEIERSSKGSAFELLQLSQTAEKAIQAHHLISEYRVDVNAYPLTEDQRQFLVWQKRFLDYCQGQDLFDKSVLPGKIFKAVAQRQLTLPDQILFVGFDQLSPSVKELMHAAENGGCQAAVVDLVTAGDSTVGLFSARDKEDEITTVARWTRHLLDGGVDSIGIVVPDLLRQRDRIERAFRDQIASDYMQKEAGETPFSLSLGKSLLEQGVIHAALECLNLSFSATIDQISFLLRTPFLGGAQKESDSRALCESRLRSFRQQRFSLSALKSLTRDHEGLIQFHQILNQCREALNSEKKSPGEWARVLMDHLLSLGWPGEKSLTSSEYQAVKSWQAKVVEQMPSLDRILPKISRTHAISLLKRMTVESDFQLESPTGQVQVVGLLESSGLSFDHLWVMGLEDRILPAQPQPNPFIPFQAQEQEQMPRSSAERELLFAEQVVARLSQAASNVVFSYPQREGDYQARPSSLVSGFAGIEAVPVAADHSPLAAYRSREQALESLEDRVGVPIVAKNVKGGTGLLKDQAHCPFRAYVHHRLQCRALEEAVPGLDAMERGDLVHRALEQIWLQLKNQDRLIALDADQLKATVKHQVERVVSDYFDSQRRPHPPGLFVTLEQSRIESLLLDWLTKVEKERDPFTVVATEQEIETDVGPLSVRIKVDRIDLLEGGYSVVIDYKTSKDLRAESFLTQPLIEPQLPLYAVSVTDTRAEGVAFAKVRKGDCRFVGLSGTRDLLPKVKSLDGPIASDLEVGDWSELLIYWAAELERLAEDFYQGEASVRPYSLKQSCRYCDLAGLCRIDDEHGLKRGDDV